MDDLKPGTLLVAPPAEYDDPTFGQTVVLLVDRESSWTVVGLVLNRPLATPVIDQAARATLFLPTLGWSACAGAPVRRALDLGGRPASARDRAGRLAPDAWHRRRRLRRCAGHAR